MVRRVGGTIHISVAETANNVQNSNHSSSPPRTAQNDDGTSSSSTTTATTQAPSPLYQTHLLSNPVPPKVPKHHVHQHSLLSPIGSQQVPSTKLSGHQDSLPATVSPRSTKHNLNRGRDIKQGLGPSYLPSVVSPKPLPASIQPFASPKPTEQKSLKSLGTPKLTGTNPGLQNISTKSSTASSNSFKPSIPMGRESPEIPTSVKEAIQMFASPKPTKQKFLQSFTPLKPTVTDKDTLPVSVSKQELNVTPTCIPRGLGQKSLSARLLPASFTQNFNLDAVSESASPKSIKQGLGDKSPSSFRQSLHINAVSGSASPMSSKQGLNQHSLQTLVSPKMNCTNQDFLSNKTKTSPTPNSNSGKPSDLKFGAKPSEIRAVTQKNRDKAKMEQARKESVRKREEAAALRMKKIKDEIDFIKQKEQESDLEAIAEIVRERFDYNEAVFVARALETSGGPKVANAKHDGEAVAEVVLESLETSGGPNIANTNTDRMDTAFVVLERFDFKQAMLAAKALEAGRGPNIMNSKVVNSKLDSAADFKEAIMVGGGPMIINAKSGSKAGAERFDFNEVMLAAKALETGGRPKVVNSKPDKKAIALEQSDFNEAMLAANALGTGVRPDIVNAKPDSVTGLDVVLERSGFKGAMFAAKALETGTVSNVVNSKPDSKADAEVVLERFDFKEAMLVAKALEAGGRPKMALSKHVDAEKVNSLISLKKNEEAKPGARPPLIPERKRSKVEEEVAASRGTKELALEEMMAERLSANQEKEEGEQAARVIGGKAVMEISDFNMPMDELMHFQNPQRLSISAAVLAAAPPPLAKTTLEATPEGKLRKVPGRRGVERTASNRVPEMRRRANQRDLLFDDDDKPSDSVIQRRSFNNFARTQEGNGEDKISCVVPSEGASSLHSKPKSSMMAVREAREAVKQEDERKINLAQREELEKARAHFDKGHDLCWKGNDSAGALVDYRKALFSRESVLGKYHEETGRSYFWIGKSLTKLQDFEEALMAYSRAFRIFERVLKKSNKYNVWTVTAIESVFRQMDDPFVDFESYKDRLDKSIRHEQSGDQLRKKGKLVEAIVDYREAIDNLAEYHPDAADLYCKIAIIMRQQGDFDRALEEYRCASEIYELSLGAEHPETVKTLNQLIEKKRLNQKSLALMEKLKMRN